MKRKVYIPILALALVAGLIGAGPAAAQLLPASELLLPYFEIELQDPGSTTLFSVANSLDKPVEIEITVHTNWGIKVLTIPSQLAAHELKSFDLRNWIVKGKLPGRALKAPELSHLEAALSGERSPQDNLYYSTEVAPGIAAGYVKIRTLGTPRPTVLWGDYFLVDPMQDAAMGDTLVSLDRASTCGTGGPICNRHALRYLQGAGFDDSTHVVLWSKQVGKPQKNRDPQPRKLRTAGTVYDDSGKTVGTVAFPILSVEVVSVADLGLTKDSGWLDLTSEQPIFIALHHGSRNHYSIALQTYCLPPPPDDPPGDEERPGISLRKLTNGEDANSAPGPTIPVGSPLTWEYEVKNTGNVQLSNITVTDDQGVDVKCPKNTLAPGETMTCTGKGVAEACQYKNIGKAVGKTESGVEVSAEDVSHYMGGQNAKIDLESAVNGQDADTPSGPEIQTGTAVNWTFVVKNTGDVQLTGIKVTDSKGLAISCPKASLHPGESMTCTASGTAAAGQFASLAAVTAASPCGSDVKDEDPGHYKGVGPGIELKKLTNGADYAQAPGASVTAGSAVTWQYVVTNTGQLTLIDVKVTDDKGVAVSCPKTTLAVGESMTCTGSGTAAACQYTNLGTATGKAGSTTVSSEDRSWYFGQPSGGIDIEKLTNGQDADTAPGPTILEGNPVQWTYVVKNSSNVVLTSVTVTDDKGVAVSCPKTTLQPGESMTCTGNGTATLGQYSNIGTATGKTACGATVSDSDASHYFGEAKPASISLKKYTNDEDADVAPGPSIKTGAPVKWTYIVTNTGQVALSNVKVTDDKGVAVSCPKTTLQPGESMTCTGNGTATLGQYKNVGTATGTPPSGPNVTDDDPSHYYGLPLPAKISLKKYTNGQDADSAPGPYLWVGDAVNWTYTVTNAGEVALSNVKVTDDRGVSVSCPKTTLQPGESMTCTGNGTATLGQYKNIGTATGTPPSGSNVSDDDPSHYYGKPKKAEISIKKHTNDVDADYAPGPYLWVGDAVKWTYTVTNTGEVALSNVKVTDDRGVAVSCPKTTLQPGESMTCTGNGTATLGQYKNIGTATGTPPSGSNVSDDDPSHYYGKAKPGYQGCTPGYWKNHTDSWPPTGYSPSQKVQNVFAKASLYPSLGSSTLLGALSFNGGSTIEGAAGNLLRAAVAALLDASHPGVNYPRTPGSVISDVNAALASGNRDTMLSLASDLDDDNNLGCPLN